jgi:hypothetical protein
MLERAAPIERRKARQMHEGHSEAIVSSLNVIAKCLLIIVEQMPKLPKDAKQSIAEMKNPTDGTAADEPSSGAVENI